MHWTGSTDLSEYGETQLASKLLKRLGFAPFIDLNREIQVNFPWADFCGKKEKQWWMINLKTRVKRQKNGSINPSYNGSKGSLNNYHSAIKILGREGFVNCKPLWLAIAMEIDQTFEAYWGQGEEMKHFMEPDIFWGIPMSNKATTIYRREKRIIADREPHDFDWLRYDDNWTYEAHQKWLLTHRI